jgi:hypothetical protein
MMELSGKISDKLRALLAAGKLDNNAINPGRPASPKKAAKLPKNVKGQSLGGRKKS